MKRRSAMIKHMRPIVSTTLMVALLSVSADCSANAWWVFHKKKPGEEGFFSRLIRKKRPISASEVGLVPGNPPALYWQTQGKPRVALLCLHEIGLYNGVFDNLGQRMAKQ